MAYRARVTLGGDPHGMHARPSGEVARAISGVNASIVFSRSGEKCEINVGSPMLSLMRAAAVLELARGVCFELTCEGPEAEDADRSRLRRKYQ